MALVRRNILTVGLKGSLGGEITMYEARTGKTVVQSKIRRQWSSTLAQRSQRAAFKRASSWAQAQEGEFNWNMKHYFAQTFGHAVFGMAVFL